MDWLPYFIIALVAVVIGNAVSPALKGNTLQQKAASLGDLNKKTKEEIIAVLGLPTAQSSNPDGTISLQWIAGTYHLVLLFKDNNCLGCSYEANVSSV